MKNGDKQKGITLVALVITIIILLILAGITISTIMQTGLFKNTKLAKEKHENAERIENFTLSEYSNEVNKYVNNSYRDSSIGNLELLVETSISNNSIKIDNINNYKILTMNFYDVGNDGGGGEYLLFSQIFPINEFKKVKRGMYATDSMNSYAIIKYVDDTTVNVQMLKSGRLCVYGIR